MTDRLLYDKHAAAAMLSTTVERVNELRRSGVLVAVQDGRQYKYTVGELTRYVESLPTSEPR